MIKRYHKKVNFPIEHKDKLQAFVSKINSQNFTFTKHCIDKLYIELLTERKVSLALIYIKNLTFQHSNIFEYYTESDYIDGKNFGSENIIRCCFRVSYTKNIDLIIVIGEGKILITVYTNNKEDNHITLNRELYTKN